MKEKGITHVLNTRIEREGYKSAIERYSIIKKELEEIPEKVLSMASDALDVISAVLTELKEMQSEYEKAAQR